MTFDLQRANVWKRISAFLFDVILLAIACVLCAWGLSALLGFDAQYQTLMARYQAAADACGLDMSIMTQTYSALTDAQRALVEQANAVLAADETAVHAYGMVIQLSILNFSFGVLSGYLLLEFLVPLLFKNGQTLGKKIFGVALMRNDGVRIGHVTLLSAQCWANSGGNHDSNHGGDDAVLRLSEHRCAGHCADSLRRTVCPLPRHAEISCSFTIFLLIPSRLIWPAR